MRFFTAAQVDAALDLDALADAIGRDVAVRSRWRRCAMRMRLSDTDTLLLMPAWSAAALGVKLVTVMPGNPARGLATVNAIYVLFDRITGAAKAVIDGEALTLRRTAAVSLLAARHLARADARNALIIGTGKLAPFMAHAHARARRLERLWVWGRRGEGAQSVAQRLRDEGLPAQAVEDLEGAVRGADIISCATTSTQPIVRGAWVGSGTHLDLVGGFRRGMREADDEAVARARIVVDTYAGALAEAADIVEPLERGVIKRSAIVAELAELVADPGRGRRRPATSRCSSRSAPRWPTWRLRSCCWNGRSSAARRSAMGGVPFCFGGARGRSTAQLAGRAGSAGSTDAGAATSSKAESLTRGAGLAAQHLARVLARGLGDLLPAEHPRQFFDAGTALEHADVRHRPPIGRTLLGHGEVLVAACRDLRQVGDAQHLATLPELLQQAAHGFRHRAADAGIDFVEDQRRHRRGRRGDDGDRERNAREFAAGGDPRQRLDRHAGMRRDHELGLLVACRRGFGVGQLHLEAPTGHREILHRPRDLGRHLAGGCAARLRER